MTRLIRFQIGHAGRTSGFTGAHNSVLDLSEVEMNRLFATHIATVARRMVNPDELRFEFLDADDRPDRGCDMFIALHMDGSSNDEAFGPSVGWRAEYASESRRFTDLWKGHRNDVLPVKWRDDNYTSALRNYYGYSNTYAAGAQVRVVIENGFVTNDDEAMDVQENMAALAMAMVKSVIDYARAAWDVDASLSLSLAEADAAEERKAERIAARQAKKKAREERRAARAARLAEQQDGTKDVIPADVKQQLRDVIDALERLLGGA